MQRLEQATTYLEALKPVETQTVHGVKLSIKIRRDMQKKRIHKQNEPQKRGFNLAKIAYEARLLIANSLEPLIPLKFSRHIMTTNSF